MASKKKRNPVNTPIDKFNRKAEPALEGLSDDIQRSIHKGNSAERAVTGALASSGIESTLKKEILAGTVEAVGIGAGVSVADPVGLKRWYLENAYDANGVRFSETINNLVRRDEIVSTVRQAMASGESWNQAAINLSRKGIQSGDTAQDVTNLLQQARNTSRIGQATQEYKEYAADIRAVQARINGLVDPSTSKLKRAYQDIVDLTRGASSDAIDKAAHYAAYFKQRYNAERIARTEMARAYGQGFFVSLNADGDATGWWWRLSDAHDEYDICDVHAGADLYGMGPGKYPLNYGPEYPAHPGCTCRLDALYGDEGGATRSDYDPDQMQQFLDDLDDDELKAVLGRGGSEAYSEDPASWPDFLKSWHGQTSITPTIPADLLFGNR
jgi:hypothetical protein